MSLSTAATVTTTTTEQIKLTPKQKVRLRRALQTYAELHMQEKVAKLAKAKQVAEVRAVREEIGVEGLEFEGFKTTNVPNLRDFFDKQRFVELGGSLETYNNAVVKKPGKAYEKVTCPGDKNGHED